MHQLINVLEHSNIEDQFSDEKIRELNKLYDESDPKYLGIHQESEFIDGVLKATLKSHYYTGYRWLDKEKKTFIRVSPKSYNTYQADYLKMFLECLNDPTVSKQLNETYEIFFDEEWIEIEESEDEVTPLIILHFLKIVKKLTQKGLKKGYIKITENLTSKIKGKILVHQTIRQNNFKNRLDRTVCNHQIFTIDCLENQIIKTALIQCARQLKGIDSEEISKLLRQNINAFKLVESREVFNSDFSNIKHSSFYKEYEEALKLAQMIFKRFGFTLDGSLKDGRYNIPPFYINMPELFERYVEVKLREVYKDNLLPGYGQKNGNSYAWGLRPDFIIKDEKIIIDAKYKYWFEKDDASDWFKDDYEQLSLYGREKSIRKDIGLLNDSEAKIIFIYPHKDGNKTIVFDQLHKYEDTFSNIYKIPLNLPLVKK